VRFTGRQRAFTLFERADRLLAMSEDPKPEEPVRGASFGSASLPPGAQFARYRIIREVGTGGMGSVYEAVLVDLHKRVALKVLSPDLAHKSEHRERFVREGRAAARIRHPNVVEIFDVGEHDGLPFLAMEFLVGRDLRARYDRGPIRPSELLDLAMPVLAAVVTAHDSQVIHRDLKPENIFLNEHPGHGVQPVVLDFGISKVLDDMSGDNLTATSTMVGTPLYMSPEQVRRSREVDPRTDQYSLGVLLYEGLTGVCAFSGNSIYDLLLKKVQGDFVPLRTLKPELPEELCSAIERAMAADREHRHPSVRALATALMPFARERTRAVWSAVLSAQPGDAAMTPEAAEAAASERADSTLRSSVKDLPAVSMRPHALRGWRLPVAIATLAVAVTVAVAAAVSRGDRSASDSAPAVRGGAPIAERSVASATAAPALVDAVPARPVLPERFTVHITAEPPTARFALDGEASGIGTLTRELIKDGQPHTVEISAEGFEPRRITFTDRAPDEREVRLVARAEPVAKAVSGDAPAAAAASEPRPRPRRLEPAARKSATSQSASPQAPSSAGAPAREGTRRTVGSNDAPVLY
jgi:serine/threonine-protein kinase